MEILSAIIERVTLQRKIWMKDFLLKICCTKSQFEVE